MEDVNATQRQRVPLSPWWLVVVQDLRFAPKIKARSDHHHPFVLTQYLTTDSRS